VNYYPNPLVYYESYSKDYQEKQIGSLRRLNSQMDLSKEIFIFNGKPNDIVSNNFEDILLALDEQIEEIARSRKVKN